MNISKIILASLVAITAPLTVANPAGILPICKDKKGTVRVLLGREASRNAQGTWCDLGGSALRGETPWQTACREAAEESCAYFRPRSRLSGRRALCASIQHIYRKKQRGDVFGCIRQPRRNGYHMYIAAFRPFDQETRRVLNGGYPHREKDKFRWVSLRGLIRDVEQGRNYYLCKDGKRLPLRREFLNLIRYNLSHLKNILRQADRKF